MLWQFLHYHEVPLARINIKVIKPVEGHTPNTAIGKTLQPHPDVIQLKP